MDGSKYQWAHLLEKYTNSDTSQEELSELYRQLESCSIKRNQFEEVTTPSYFKKSLIEFQKGDIEKTGKT